MNLILNNIIKEGRSYSFSEIMALALYHPDFGYYMQEDNPIANSRDYITAPEISDSIGYACAKAWSELGISNGVLCEVGPGSGSLVTSMAKYLLDWGLLPKKIILVEKNKFRKIDQQKKLISLSEKVYNICEWRTSMPDTGWSGMLVAHEVLDAQPFDIAIKSESSWLEKRVVKKDGCLNWELATARLEIAKHLENVNVSDGYQTEVLCETATFLDNCCKNLTSGGIIFIDYGYSGKEFFHEQRVFGTSKTFKKHLSSDDLLSDIGNKDITCHVNFSFVKDIIENYKYEANGFFTLGQFLIKTNSHEHLSNLSGLGYHEACMAFKQVLFGMGDTFKCLLASRKNNNWQKWLNDFGVNRLI